MVAIYFTVASRGANCRVSTPVWYTRYCEALLHGEGGDETGEAESGYPLNH